MWWLVMVLHCLQVVHTAFAYLSACCMRPMKTWSTSAAGCAAAADASASTRRRSAFRFFVFLLPAHPSAVGG
jgi:hypothetical protein